ncbi:MAG: polysaccharide deacetylase family protein [Chloroflexota bacterium]
MPSVSVVVPAHNEEAFIASCLGSLARQDYRGDYEVIVVDNASDDSTATVACDYGAQVLYERRPGPACARQKGLDCAKGEIVAFIDADSQAPPHWISSLISGLLADPALVFVSGPYAFSDLGPVVRILSRVANFVAIWLDHVFRRVWRKGGALWGSNFAARRAALIAAGGFDTGITFLGEDYELSLRLATQGRGAVLPSLCIPTSGRRLREQGLFVTYFDYVVNYFCVLFAGRPIPPRIQGLPRRVRKGTTACVHLFWRLRFYLVVVVAGVLVGEVVGVALTGCVVASSCVLAGLAIHDGVSPRSSVYGRVFARGPDCSSQVALTFDDGPNPRCTWGVLDTLRHYGIHATFFLTGQKCELYPDLCRAIAVAGHTVGSHSYRHDRMLSLRMPRTVSSDLERTSNSIRSASGMETRLFRPPYGFRTPWLMKVLQDRGYRVVTWDVMTDDWDSKKKSADVVRDVVSHTRGGSIIVLHDGRSQHLEYERKNLLEALPPILESLRRHGYELVTVPELLGRHTASV